MFNAVEPLNKDTFGTVLWRKVLIFYGVCIQEYFWLVLTFGLSFVGRFVLFQSVLYQRFHCNLGTYVSDLEPPC